VSRLSAVDAVATLISSRKCLRVEVFRRNGPPPVSPQLTSGRIDSEAVRRAKRSSARSRGGHRWRGRRGGDLRRWPFAVEARPKPRLCLIISPLVRAAPTSSREHDGCGHGAADARRGAASRALGGRRSLLASAPESFVVRLRGGPSSPAASRRSLRGGCWKVFGRWCRVRSAIG